jgi:hypothetical protein
MKISWGTVDAEIKKNGFIKGLFLGLIVLTVNIGSFYYIIGMAKQSPVLILSGTYALTVLVPLVVIALFVLNARSKNGGYFTFKQVVISVFIMTLTSYGILLIGRDALFSKFVEPDMATKISKVMSDSRISKEKVEGVSTDRINKDIIEKKQNYDFRGENNNLLIVENIPENILMLFVLAILFAAAFKKDPPVLVEKTIE